jgi:hypothetical protein
LLISPSSRTASPYDLLAHGRVIGRISLTLACHANVPDVQTNSDPLAAANIEADRALTALARHNVTPSGVSGLSGATDVAASTEGPIDSAYQNATALAPFIPPLGEALSSLQRLVEIVDGVAEVHILYDV